MSKQIQLRRGTAAQHAAFTGAVGELTVSTDDKSLRVHDGVTLGGSAVMVAGSDDWLRAYAGLSDACLGPGITRNADGAITSAEWRWPDGTVGEFTALVISSTHPSAVDSYQVTYGAKTATQPPMTRDPISGAVVGDDARPIIIIS